MGSAALIQQTITNLQRRDANALREMLWSDEWLDLGLTAFRTRLADAERDAVRLYFESIELVGGQQDKALLLLLGALQVKTLDEVRGLVDTARSAEGVGLESATQQAITLLSRRIKSEPGFREDCARTLFGVDLAVSSASVVDDAEGSVASKGALSEHERITLGLGYENGEERP